MFGSYTALEIEAERRREVLEAPMRRRALLGQGRRPDEWIVAREHRERFHLATVTAGPRTRVGQSS